MARCVSGANREVSSALLDLLASSRLKLRRLELSRLDSKTSWKRAAQACTAPDGAFSRFEKLKWDSANSSAMRKAIVGGAACCTQSLKCLNIGFPSYPAALILTQSFRNGAFPSLTKLRLRATWSASWPIGKGLVDALYRCSQGVARAAGRAGFVGDGHQRRQPL